ncbi:MAG: folate-binding protein YgfZ [Betaproteobacteria bacterium]|nr:folate-binding protein YgfZ [Betaproteobacteria bacterium]
MQRARLSRYGLLSVTGADARAFLQAQLTNDIEHLPGDRWALAGWCSAKGRLLASFIVIPSPDGFLLQLARDLAAPVAKRLSMFVLRSKVKIADLSDTWAQFGVWDADVSGEVSWRGNVVSVRVSERRFLQVGAASELSEAPNADEVQWTLQEIRAGRPLITSATQDQFVPQMVNFEALGGVDFRKGCYPGQEIVARAQYRGQGVKRRMVHTRAPAGVSLQPGQEFNGGTVVDAAPAEGGAEVLAVMPI